jgi:hypothetical protein
MNAQEFVIWLNGFLEASGKGGLETHQVDKIRQALDNVHEKSTISTIVPDYPRVDNGEMVPHHTICGCNPANGGSGICGCIMGNKLVPKVSKTNIYTTTSDNIPFNWKYENGKQILND